MKGYEEGKSMVYMADTFHMEESGREASQAAWRCLEDLRVEVLISPTATHLIQAEHTGWD